MASNRKFMSALNALCEEKGIEKDVFLEMLKESIAKAYKKNYMVPEANVRVEINEKTGKIRLFEIRTVVDDLEDEDLEVSLDEAHDINPNNFSDKKYAKLKKKHYIMNLLIKKMISLQVLLIVLNLNLLLSILEKLEHF